MTNRELAKELCDLASIILEQEDNLEAQATFDSWLSDVYELCRDEGEESKF